MYIQCIYVCINIYIYIYMHVCIIYIYIMFAKIQVRHQHYTSIDLVCATEFTAQRSYNSFRLMTENLRTFAIILGTPTLQKQLKQKENYVSAAGSSFCFKPPPKYNVCIHIYIYIYMYIHVYMLYINIHPFFVCYLLVLELRPIYVYSSTADPPQIHCCLPLLPTTGRHRWSALLVTTTDHHY